MPTLVVNPVVSTVSTATFKDLVAQVFEGRGQEQDPAHAGTEGTCVVHAQYFMSQLYVGRTFQKEGKTFFRSISAEGRCLGIQDQRSKRWFTPAGKLLPAEATDW
jgi:hypothetical protein